MRPIRYYETDLPMQDLESIGLASKGQLLLNVDDLRALLSGGRTGLMQLHDLNQAGMHIAKMDAKLSLHKNEAGKTELLVHPVYRKADVPDFLDEADIEKLEKGETANLLKMVDGNEVLVEYDAETREFIVSDTDLIIAPHSVNSEQLTEDQKLRYKKGKEVQLADGTILNYAAGDVHGIRSNKLALVASLLVDGGISYLVFKGLNALYNKKQEPDANKLSPGYYKALAEMESQKPRLVQHFDQHYTRSR